jgi:hypothetical protein
VALLVVLLYLASVGPVVGISERGWVSDAVYDTLFDTVYFPLSWIDDNTEFFKEHPVGKPYSDYVYLWEP